MDSLNIFNIVLNLKKLIDDNYIYVKSDLNELEVDLSKGIFSFLEKFIENLNNEDSKEELVDLFEENHESDFDQSPEESEESDSESETIPRKKTVNVFILDRN